MIDFETVAKEAFIKLESDQLRSVSPENDRPEDSGEEEEERQRKEDCGERDFAGRQVVVAVLLDDVDVEVGGG